MRADAPLLRFGHRITNYGPKPLDYLWKLHPALNITPNSCIDMPARRMIVDPGFRDRIGVDTFTWPHAPTAGGTVDMRQVAPQEAATCDFYYATELDAGWCALTDSATRSGFGLVFDPALFRSVWVFGAYGGWRGLYDFVVGGIVRNDLHALAQYDKTRPVLDLIHRYLCLGRCVGKLLLQLRGILVQDLLACHRRYVPLTALTRGSETAYPGMRATPRSEH